MATKDWKIAYKAQDKENSHIYTNSRKNLWIQRGSKQLGAFDNFEKEKYPVTVQGTGGRDIEKKWFDTKGMANKYMRSYMGRN